MLKRLDNLICNPQISDFIKNRSAVVQLLHSYIRTEERISINFPQESERNQKPNQYERFLELPSRMQILKKEF